MCQISEKQSSVIIFPLRKKKWKNNSSSFVENFSLRYFRNFKMLFNYGTESCICRIIIYLYQSNFHERTILKTVFSSVTQSCLTLQLTTAHQASLFITSTRSPPKPISIESVMPSNHLILCRPLLLLPSILPSIRV